MGFCFVTLKAFFKVIDKSVLLAPAFHVNKVYDDEAADAKPPDSAT